MQEEVELVKKFISDECCPRCELHGVLELKYLYFEPNPMIHEFKCGICGNTGIVSFKSKNRKTLVMDEGKYKTKQNRKLLKKQKYE